MKKTVVLILLTADDKNAVPFRKEIDGRPSLSPFVDLRFASKDGAHAMIEDADVIECLNLPVELLAAARSLRWVSFWSAGLDKRITPEMERRNLMITSASGVHGPNIAEQVIAYMLMFTRKMPLFLRSQDKSEWVHGASLGFEELTGKTLGIVGFGHIGRTLGSRARAFGMYVVATKRDTSAISNSDDFIPDRLYPATQLPKMLAASDHICISVPYTTQTHHLINEAMLAHLKPSAYLYNVSRGSVVDEQSLIAALDAGRLRGAGLDVFETEPLARDSPLWKMKNVIITPHVAGFTPYYFERVAALFADNLERYLEGKPLRNLYVPARGY